MPTAFVLIQAEPRKIANVAQSIADTVETAEVYSVTGEFDILVILRTAEYEELSNAVPERLALIDGVLRTHTLLAFRQFSSKDRREGWDIGVT